MKLEELDNQIFWLCYVLFLVAVLCIPLYRNLYSTIKYKISAKEGDRRIIDSFCENNKCICASTHSIAVVIMLILSIPVCILCTKGTLVSSAMHGTHRVLINVIVTLFLHIIYIRMYVNYIYSMCFVAQYNILIRCGSTKYLFNTIKINDVLKYAPFNSGILGWSHLQIAVKNNRLLILTWLGNRKELIAALDAVVQKQENKNGK